LALHIEYGSTEKGNKWKEKARSKKKGKGGRQVDAIGNETEAPSRGNQGSTESKGGTGVKVIFNSHPFQKEGPQGNRHVKLGAGSPGTAPLPLDRYGRGA
jgi:hypothetical protein